VNQEPIQNENEASEQLISGRTLIVRIGDERFGLPLDLVKEVLELPAVLVSVPGAPRWMLGIINHHGHVVPVVRMSFLAKVSGADNPKHVILAKTNQDLIGLAVDQIESLDMVKQEVVTNCEQTGYSRAWYRGSLLEQFDSAALDKTIRQLLAQHTRQVDGVPRA